MSQEFSDQEHKEIDFRGEDFTGLTYENCTFIDCNFSEVSLKRVSMAYCKFQNCDLSNVNVTSARLHDLVFRSCKLMGVNFSLAESLRLPTFEGCNLNFASFRNSVLKNIKMIECRVHDANFLDTDLSQADLSQSDFLGTIFNRCTLLKADFRSARNFQIDPVNNKVKGAKFTLPEAVGLLVGFGIVLE